MHERQIDVDPKWINTEKRDAAYIITAVQGIVMVVLDGLPNQDRRVFSCAVYASGYVHGLEPPPNAQLSTSTYYISQPLKYDTASRSTSIVLTTSISFVNIFVPSPLFISLVC